MFGQSLHLRTLTTCYVLFLLVTALHAAPILPSLRKLVDGTNVYIIRHGEKPADGSEGLTRKGRLRAQCVKRVSTHS